MILILIYFLQKMEGLWGQLDQHSDIIWFREKLASLEETGVFSRENALDR